MEDAHVQRRSVSHGSLRSSYKYHARMHVGQSLPRRPPLRSVNENASLLPSPGPLESMLKTTTETGDIGIFTIKPVAPATTIHHFARSRSGLDAGSIFGMEPRASDGTLSGAGRRRRGSDRDTNSEIISMYGFEDPTSSLSSSLSPRNDGMCHRSYSLTTCDSHHQSSQKSSGTMQSQSSSGILQRPRSPFPYPTRLKRPGVRPSSPALTENGLVDYSRMVEIDRISYRTVHGSYKPTFPQSQRLAPPLVLHPSLNQSMPSLPYPKSLVSPTGSIARDHGPNNWGNGPMKRARRPSTDQSVRSSSLTSVIEMYCRLPSSSEPNLQHTLRPAGSFYYDYTEGFESPYSQADHLEPMAAFPLAPIPQRASSLIKALVLRDENKAHLDAVVDISVKDSSESSGDDGQIPGSSQVNDIATLPSQRMNCRTAPPILEPFPFEVDDTSASRLADFGTTPGISESLSPCVDAEKSDPSLTAQASSSMHDEALSIGTPLDKEQTNTEKKALEARTDPSPPHKIEDRQLNDGFKGNSELLGDTVAHRGETKAFSGNLTAKEHASRRASSRSGLAAILRSSLRHSVDPGLSDLVALVSSFDHIAKSPLIRKDKDISGRSNTAEQTDLQNPRRPAVDPMTIGVATDGGEVVNDEPHTIFRSQKPFFKGHRRNQALANISMASLQVRRSASVRSVGLPLPAPESASATAALRGSTSHPYLMKALPTLPNDAPTPAQEVSKASAEDLGFPVKFSPFQLELLATPRSSPRITVHQDVEDHESFRASIELEVAPANSAQPFTECSSTAGEMAQVENIDVAGQPHGKSTGQSQCHNEELSPTKRRLRLRATRTGAKPGTTCFQEIESGTVRRHPRLEQSTLTELPSFPAEDLLTPIRRGRRQNSTAYQRRGRQIALIQSDGQCDGVAHLAHRPPASRVFGDKHLHESDIPLAHPVDANLLRHSTSTYGFDLSDSRSFGSEYTFIRPRILRKKLSNMKIRLTKSRLNFRGHADMNTERQPRQNSTVGSSDSDDTILRGQRRSTVPPNQSKRMGRKMRRWIRRAVRVCVKGRRGESKTVS